MCGIVGLHLRGEAHQDRLGALLGGMLNQLRDRGPDSAGVAVYGDPRLSGGGRATVSALAPGVDAADAAAAVRAALGPVVPSGAAAVTATRVGGILVVRAPVPPDELRAAVGSAVPAAGVIGFGHDLLVQKGVGYPGDLVGQFGLADRVGWQGIGHTRMATESAVTVAHCHPFAVRADLCLVHNGSFANYATVRRELVAAGAGFDTDNDSEVAARFVGAALDDGDGLEKALRRLGETLDGFYTLLVTTATEFAVGRDAYAGKPAIIAETPEWVAMASEYRALAGLPGIAGATVYEPTPGEVYRWSR